MFTRIFIVRLNICWTMNKAHIKVKLGPTTCNPQCRRAALYFHLSVQKPACFLCQTCRELDTIFISLSTKQAITSVTVTQDSQDLISNFYLHFCSCSQFAITGESQLFIQLRKKSHRSTQLTAHIQCSCVNVLWSEHSWNLPILSFLWLEHDSFSSKVHVLETQFQNRYMKVEIIRMRWDDGGVAVDKVVSGFIRRWRDELGNLFDLSCDVPHQDRMWQ